MFRHDAVEDPLLFYVNASEALFVVTLALVFLAARGSRFAAWRRASLAAVLSARLRPRFRPRAPPLPGRRAQRGPRPRLRQGDLGTGGPRPPLRRRPARGPPL